MSKQAFVILAVWMAMFVAAAFIVLGVEDGTLGSLGQRGFEPRETAISEPACLFSQPPSVRATLIDGVSPSRPRVRQGNKTLCIEVLSAEDAPVPDTPVFLAARRVADGMHSPCVVLSQGQTDTRGLWCCSSAAVLLKRHVRRLGERPGRIQIFARTTESFAGQAPSQEIKDPETTHLTLRLPRTERVKVRMVCDLTRALEGARLSILSKEYDVAGLRRSYSADRFGVLELTHRPHLDSDILVRMPVGDVRKIVSFLEVVRSSVPHQIDFLAGQDVGYVDLFSSEGKALGEGSVTYALGPAGAATCQLSEVRTDAAGRLIFNLPTKPESGEPHAMRLTVMRKSAEGFQEVGTRVVRVISGGGVHDFGNLQLERDVRHICGRVVGVSRKPIAGARVRLLMRTAGPGSPFVPTSTARHKTDQNGEFRIPSDRGFAREMAVAVSKRGFQRVARHGVSPGQQETVVLRKCATLRGRLQLPRGALAEWFAVRVVDGGNQKAIQVSRMEDDDRDGICNFSFESAPHASARLEVRAFGLRDPVWNRGVELVEGGAVEVGDVDLRSAARCSRISIVDELGRPVHPAAVVLLVDDDRRRCGVESTGGAVSILVGQGPVELLVVAPGFAVRSYRAALPEERIVLRRSHVVELSCPKEFSVPEGASVVVRLTCLDSLDLSSSMILFSGAPAISWRRGRIDSQNGRAFELGLDGRASLRVARSGDYRMEVSVVRKGVAHRMQLKTSTVRVEGEKNEIVIPLIVPPENPLRGDRKPVGPARGSW